MIRYINSSITGHTTRLQYPFFIHPILKKLIKENLDSKPKHSIKCHSTLSLLPSKNLINKGFFKYSNKTSSDVICVIFYTNIIRAILRSFYKLIEPNRKLMGLSEISVLFLRKGFYEPLEYFLFQDGWMMLHGATMQHHKKSFLLIAPSKGGKSTVSSILEDFGCQILGDNYCFLKSNQVYVPIETQRQEPAKRMSFSFYGKSFKKHFDERLINIESILLLKKGEPLLIQKISTDEALMQCSHIYEIEKEGFHFDPTYKSIKNSKKNICSSIKCYELGTGENLVDLYNNLEGMVNEVLSCKDN